MNRNAFWPLIGASAGDDEYFIARFRSNNNSTDGMGVALNTDHDIYIAGAANDGNAYALAFKLDKGGSEVWTKANTSIDYYRGCVVDSTDEPRVYFAGGDTGEFYMARHNASTGAIQYDAQRTRSGVQAHCVHMGDNGNDRLCISGYSGNPDFQSQLGDTTLWVVDVSGNSSANTNDNFAVGSGAHDARGGATIAQFNDSSAFVFMAGYNQHGDANDKLVICENSGTTRNRTIAFSDAGGTPGSLAVDTQAGPVYGTYLEGANSNVFAFKISPFGGGYSINWAKQIGKVGGVNELSIRGAIKIYDSGNKILTAIEDTTGADEVHVYSLNTSDGSVNWERKLSSSFNDLSCSAIAIDPVDEEYFVLVGTDTSGGNSAFVCKLPIDGSGTGTYGSISYHTGSLHGISSKTISTVSRSVSNVTTNWGSGTSPGYSLTDKTFTEVEFQSVS